MLDIVEKSMKGRVAWKAAAVAAGVTDAAAEAHRAKGHTQTEIKVLGGTNG